MEKPTNLAVQHDEDVTRENFTNDERPDSISSEAIGGASIEDLPPRYFLSYKFIGSFIVGLYYKVLNNCLFDSMKAFALAYQSNFLGFTMIANVLTVIDEDLGNCVLNESLRKIMLNTPRSKPAVNLDIIVIYPCREYYLYCCRTTVRYFWSQMVLHWWHHFIRSRCNCLQPCYKYQYDYRRGKLFFSDSDTSSD